MNNQMGFNFDSEVIETVEQKKARELAEKEAAKKEAEEKKRLENELNKARAGLRTKLEELKDFAFSKVESDAENETEEEPTEDLEEETEEEDEEDFEDEE